MMQGALALRKKYNSITGDQKRDMALEHFCAKHPIRGAVRLALRHTIYEYSSALVVIFSSVLIGVEIEFEAQHRDFDRVQLFALQCSCCFFFVGEVFCRMFAYGYDFWKSKEWKW